MVAQGYSLSQATVSSHIGPQGFQMPKRRDCHLQSQSLTRCGEIRWHPGPPSSDVTEMQRKNNARDRT